ATTTAAATATLSRTTTATAGTATGCTAALTLCCDGDSQCQNQNETQRDDPFHRGSFIDGLDCIQLRIKRPKYSRMPCAYKALLSIASSRIFRRSSFPVPSTGSASTLKNAEGRGIHRFGRSISPSFVRHSERRSSESVCSTRRRSPFFSSGPLV